MSNKEFKLTTVHQTPSELQPVCVDNVARETVFRVVHQNEFQWTAARLCGKEAKPCE
jgi:hypothetical protein